MAKPQDILHKPWNRRTEDGWTTAAFRAPVLAFMQDFLATHNWADAWDVTERFTDNGLNVRFSALPQQGGEVERPGVKILVLGVTRWRDGHRFEVALSFPSATADSARLLDRARLTLEAEHRRNPT